MSRLMILVANHSFARFLRAGLNGGLFEAATLANPEYRQYGHELYSDAPTHVQDRFGSARHAQEPRTSMKEKLAERFAREICQWLEAARIRQDYSKLILIAPSDMLGHIRAHLSDESRKTVIEESHLNIVQREVDNLFEAMPESVQRAIKRAAH